MANISRDELLHVARLARLDLPEEELQRLGAQLNDILKKLPDGITYELILNKEEK